MYDSPQKSLWSIYANVQRRTEAFHQIFNKEDFLLRWKGLANKLHRRRKSIIADVVATTETWPDPQTAQLLDLGENTQHPI